MDKIVGENNEDQSYSAGDMVSENREEQNMIDPDELSIQEKNQHDNIISNSEVINFDPPTEPLHTDVDKIESPSILERELPVAESAEGGSDNPSILRKHLLEFELDKNIDGEEGAENISEVNDEESITEVETAENLDRNIPCVDESTNSLHSLQRDTDELIDGSVEVSKDEQAVELDQSESNEVLEIHQDRNSEVIVVDLEKSSEMVELVKDKDNQVVELNKDEGSEVIGLDQDSSDVKEIDAKESTDNILDAEEISAPSVPEPVAGVIQEDQLSHSYIEEDIKQQEVIKPVETLVAEVKKRRGRPKRSTSQSDLNCSGNGLPEEEELDDSNAGRPRRKAAQKAGDQIRQIVDNEDEVTELVYSKKDEAKEWNEVTGCPPRMICFQCCRLRSCQYHLLVNGISRYMCSTPCFQAFRRNHPGKSHLTKKKDTELRLSDTMPSIDVGIGGEMRMSSAPEGRLEDKDRVLECAFCQLIVMPPTSSEKSLSWETMEFCNEDCLGKYQDQLGSCCSQCKVPVQKISMGKYCVRFGYNIKQFCCSTCLEEFKKGLKTCTYCQKDISTGAEGFLAPVGDKGQFKDFCSPACMEKYDHISSGTRPPIKEAACAVCDKSRQVFVEVVAGRLAKDSTVITKMTNSVYSLCSDPCFAAFKYVNQLKTEQCESCQRYFDTSKPEEKPTTFFYDGGYHCCCRACLNIFILTHRTIVQCNWCRVKKYDFDMIKRIKSSGQILMMCSLNCLNLYQVSINAVSSRSFSSRVRCDFCNEVSQAQYHLTMSDATVRNFCTYECVMSFQSQYSKTPLTLPEDEVTPSIPSGSTSQQASNKRTQALTVQSGPVPAHEVESNMPPIPIISSVQSLATDERNVSQDTEVTPVSMASALPDSIHSLSKVSGANNGLAFRQVIVMPASAKSVRNKKTSCKPAMISQSVECQPSLVDNSTQTDKMEPKVPALIPVPVPIYVPMPMHMYCNPFPVPTPFPLPIPVPIAIPSKFSYEEIKKRAKVFQSVAPEEAEVLMMAELVADEEAKDQNVADPVEVPSPGGDYENPVHSDSASDSDNEDRKNSADLTSLSELRVDLEESIAISTVNGPAYSEEGSGEEQLENERSQGLKRKGSEQSKEFKAKRPRCLQSEQSEEEDESTELKASLGVSAWQVWVQQKNSELSKVTSNSRRLKLFKTELLQMTLEELNYALCLFVKEVRKPGGDMYAPDTILYFCLGIQHYLMENGRVDNIFTDLYFEKFTECLDQVAKTFPPLTKETSLISTRVMEEHLWESRQLGAHSPYVLLSTLVFFNTKYFRLWTVEDHAKLTFSSVVKVWKKPRGRPLDPAKASSSSNRTPAPYSILRYTHPDQNSEDGKVYEQHENLITPLRCPVKLYEFYLSKCPEPVRRGGDLFYLLPERACVPDSPVWYSSVALGSDALGKILHRIQMVKEINEAYVNELSEESTAIQSSPEARKEKGTEERAAV